MLDLPRIGERVWVWPMPGRRVPLEPMPIDAPLLQLQRFLPSAGCEVVWSYWHMERMVAGDFLLHPPPCEEHDHGSSGADDCRRCGRSLVEAQVYDVHYADGVEETKLDAQAAADAAAQADKAAVKAEEQRVADAKKAAADAVADAKKSVAEKKAARAKAAPVVKTSADPSQK